MSVVHVITENIPDIQINFDEYYLSPNGFLDTCVVRDKQSKIVYYDVNSSALSFKKYLITNWSCKKKDLWQIINDLPYNYTYDFTVSKNNNFLTHKETFELGWSQLSNSDTFEKFKIIQNSTVTFKYFDIVNNPMLCSLVNFSPAKKYFWFGNHFVQSQLNSVNLFNIFKATSVRHQMFLTGIDPVTNKNMHNFIYTNH